MQWIREQLQSYIAAWRHLDCRTIADDSNGLPYGLGRLTASLFLSSPEVLPTTVRSSIILYFRSSRYNLDTAVEYIHDANTAPPKYSLRQLKLLRDPRFLVVVRARI